jgi:hypothetical protein
MTTHRIALMSQKIGELLSNSMKLYQLPNHALEDILYVFTDFKATQEDKEEVYRFLYDAEPDGGNEITLGELRFMLAVCGMNSFTVRPPRPRLVIGTPAPDPTPVNKAPTRPPFPTTNFRYIPRPRPAP